MIADFQTNKVYLSSLIKSGKYETFWKDLEKIFVKHDIRPEFIEGTRDIWCRDYMPVQIDTINYSQFKYFPDYCIDHKNIKWLTIQEEMRYVMPRVTNIKQVDLIVDGGNIVKYGSKAIITEKVFKENKNREKESVVRILKNALKVDDLNFIPQQPFDYTGHADGMVRFYDENTLLVNDFRKETDTWRKKLNNAIKLTGLKLVEFPYAPSDKKVNGDYTAKGCYINYAQIGNLIVFPKFGINEDGKALQMIKKLYPEPRYNVETIDCTAIANEGGVLNCITWNIYKQIMKDAIDELVPVYGDRNRMFVVYKEDIGLKLKDTLCVPISLSEPHIGDPWSLQKHLKFTHAIEPLITDEEKESAKKLLSDHLSTEQLSDVLDSLLHPPMRTIEELLEVPPRLSGMRKTSN